MRRRETFGANPKAPAMSHMRHGEDRMNMQRLRNRKEMRNQRIASGELTPNMAEYYLSDPTFQGMPTKGQDGSEPDRRRARASMMAQQEQRRMDQQAEIDAINAETERLRQETQAIERRMQERKPFGSTRTAMSVRAAQAQARRSGGRSPGFRRTTVDRLSTLG